MVGTKNLEELAEGLPNHVYPVFDLYGKCERITILSVQEVEHSSTSMQEETSIFEQMLLNDTDSRASVPECEKADLETHEKCTTKTKTKATKPKIITSTIGDITINLSSL